MANIQNLVPFNNKDAASVAQARQMGSKGGKVCSPAKKHAAAFREMKKRGFTAGDSDAVLAGFLDGDISSFSAFSRINTIYKDTSDEKIALSAIKTHIEWHRMHHGAKDSVINDMSTNLIHIDYNDEQTKMIDNIDKKLSSMSKAQMREMVIDVG